MAPPSTGNPRRPLFESQDLGVARNPRPAYQRLRSGGSVQQGSVSVTGRREVEEVLRHPEIYSSALGSRLGGAPRQRPLRPLELDPPAHTALRAALDPLFAPWHIDGLAKSITVLAADLVEGIATESEIDFGTRFSVPFPAQVLMTVLGLPLEDLAWLLDINAGVVRPNRALGKPMDDPEVVAYRSSMTTAAYDYFGAALDQREQERTDDLLSRLLDVEVEGGPLPRDDVLDVCFALLVEGVDSVSAALDCSFACLAERPALREQVAANPRQALEELLRWETPVMFVARTATVDTELGGCPISAGQRVFALLGAANIDPAETPDAGLLRCDREVNRHLAFGAGIHRCLGSHLARLQLTVALKEWHSRIPDYSLKRGARPGFTPGVRTADRLLLRLGRSE